MLQQWDVGMMAQKKDEERWAIMETAGGRGKWRRGMRRSDKGKNIKEGGGAREGT